MDQFSQFYFLFLLNILIKDLSYNSFNWNSNLPIAELFWNRFEQAAFGRWRFESRERINWPRSAELIDARKVKTVFEKDRKPLPKRLTANHLGNYKPSSLIMIRIRLALSPFLNTNWQLQLTESELLTTDNHPFPRRFNPFGDIDQLVVDLNLA